MTKQELKHVFDSFSGCPILVIGDAMIDSYMWGRVDRISPEAPVPIVHILKKEDRLGGAANVALNLASLGAQPLLCCLTGNDEKADLLERLCHKNNISTEGVVRSDFRSTTIKTRVIGGIQHLLRVDEEDNRMADEQETTALANRIIDVVLTRKIKAIIIEDYDKGVVSPFLINLVAGKANSLGIPVCVDPKKRNFDQFKYVTLFKPNFREFAEGLNSMPDKGDGAAIFAASQNFQHQNNISEMMVTLSEHGIFVSNGTEYYVIPSHVRDVADVSGAGDTVISVAGLCKALGLDMYHTAVISNIAGGLVCEKPGVVPVHKEQLFEAVTNYLSL